MKKIRKRKQEKGVALLFVLLAIMLLSAIAVGMLYTATIETTVSANFKTQERAYFAARGGIEEMKQRLLQSDVNTIWPLLHDITDTNSLCKPVCLNLKTPGQGPTGVIYILNGVTAAQVTTPPTPGNPNPFYDDELCHDYGQDPAAGMVWVPSNVPCTTQPPGGPNAWATFVQSVFQSNNPAVNPFGTGNAAAAQNSALEYKWVRITWKENASLEGDSLASNKYWVDPSAGKLATDKICWNGAYEVVLSGVGQCDKVPSALATPPGPGPYGPVLLVTALAVTSNIQNLPGIRRMVQMEIQQTPVVGANFGAFAVSTSCSAMKFAGNASTGSFNSSGENPPTNPPSNLNSSTTAAGNIGSNNNVLLGGTSTAINGLLGTASGNQNVGACPGAGVSTTGNPTAQGVNPASACPQQAWAGPPAPQPPTCPITDITSQTFPPPAAPNPLPPTTANKYTKSATLTPGTYGNVQMTAGATLTLPGGTPGNPAVYVMNSLSMAGGSTLNITGPVILKFGGQGVTNVIDMTGGQFANTTNVPGNFVIQYAGPSGPMTGTGIILHGGSQAYGSVYAPQADVSFKGGSNFYGQVVANTVDDQGGTNLYYDEALTNPPAWNSPYTLISLRELSY